MSDIKLCSVDECTQCGACIAICKHHAISFSLPNQCGDRFPEIDKNQCISCGLCVKVCPQLSNQTASKNDFAIKYYAGWSKNYRLKGSSGGIFCEIASFFLLSGGYVCGAAFDDVGKLSHQVVSDIGSLPPLLGSKYLTSEAHSAFSQIKELLENQKKVLFVGTPCQVAGLKSYLKRNYDTLLTIDLVCFGAPTQEIYQSYIKKIPVTDTIVAYLFRRLDSNRPDCRIKYSNGGIARIPNKYYTYIDGFVRGLSMKKVCYECKYKNMQRVGDITLGDYHTVRTEKPILKRKISKGVSLIIINTPKGEFFFEKNIDKMELFQKNMEQVKATNISLNEQLELPEKRDEFCCAMCNRSKSLEEINRDFHLNGLRFSLIRFTPFCIKILDIKKDILQFINAVVK